MAPETQNHWLKNGDDRNTKFFHAFASERRRRNGIKKLVKEDGGVVVEEKELHELITNFYKDLFRSAAVHVMMSWWRRFNLRSRPR